MENENTVFNMIYHKKIDLKLHNWSKNEISRETFEIKGSRFLLFLKVRLQYCLVKATMVLT